MGLKEYVVVVLIALAVSMLCALIDIVRRMRELKKESQKNMDDLKRKLEEIERKLSEPQS